MKFVRGKLVTRILLVLFLIVTLSIYSREISGINTTASDTAPSNGTVEPTLVEEEPTTTTTFPDLVLNLKFDEGSGTIAHDASGNGNDGTIVGNAAWTPGITGSALLLDGINDYVAVADSPSISALGSATLEAWIKPKNLDTSVIFQKWGPGGDGDDEYYLGLESGVVRFVVEGSGFNDVALTFPSSALKVNEWNYIAATLNAGQEMRLYLNGNLMSSLSTLATQNKDTTQTLYIGASNFGPGQFEGFFNGAIDEVSIWRRALTEEEIKARFNAVSNNFFTSSVKCTAVNQATTVACHTEIPGILDKDLLTIDLKTVTMTSEFGIIKALIKTSTITDIDGDGIKEYPIFFTSADVNKIFKSPQTTVTIKGRFSKGEFRGETVLKDTSKKVVGGESVN